MSELLNESFEQTSEPLIDHQLSLVALSLEEQEPPVGGSLDFDPKFVKAWHKQINSRAAGDYLSDPEQASPGQLNDETIALLALYATIRDRSKLASLEATLDQLMSGLEIGVPAAAELHHVMPTAIHNKKGQMADHLATELDRLIGGIEPEAAEPAPRKPRAASPKSKPKIAPERPRQRQSNDKDDFGMYLDEIAKVPLLNAEKEVELAKTIEAGLMAGHLLETDGTDEGDGDTPMDARREELEWLAAEGQKAVQAFITANLRLVVSLAKRYTRSGMPILDLVQEGNTGLIRAVEKFDYQKGYKFSTYATWWIRQAITRGIAKQARAVHLPVHVIEEINQVNSAKQLLERELGREPEPEEIADELKIDVERVTDLTKWSREHISLDMPISEDGDTTFGDLMAQEATPSPEHQVVVTSEQERLRALIQQLEDERLIDIISARFGLKDGRIQKLADIGRQHGISAERTRQLEREALAKLRQIAAQGDKEFIT